MNAEPGKPFIAVGATTPNLLLEQRSYRSRHVRQAPEIYMSIRPATNFPDPETPDDPLYPDHAE